MFEKKRVDGTELEMLTQVQGRGRTFSAKADLWEMLGIGTFTRGDVMTIPLEYKGQYGYIRMRLSRFMKENGGQYHTKCMEGGELLIVCSQTPLIPQLPRTIPINGPGVLDLLKDHPATIPLTQFPSINPPIITGAKADLIPEVELKLTPVPSDHPLPEPKHPTQDELQGFLRSFPVGEVWTYIEGETGQQSADNVEQWANELDFIQAFKVGIIVEIERID